MIIAIMVIIAQTNLLVKRIVAVEEGKLFLYTELFQLCNESTVAMAKSVATMTKSTLAHKTLLQRIYQCCNVWNDIEGAVAFVHDIFLSHGMMPARILSKHSNLFTPG